MAGGSASIAATKIAQIPVQTSALGVAIPIGWGTGLVKPNVIDLEDFAAVVVTTSSGGKGGGVKQSNYKYTSTVILGLCAGPILGVSQVFVDKNIYASVSAAGFSLATGAVGQSVWSYMTTNHPTHARGYSGLAYVYANSYPLNDQAGLPNHQFEVRFTSHVSGLADANPADILTDFLTNTLYGLPGWGSGLLGDLTDFGNYCLATNLLLSPVLDQQTQASQVITDLMTATNCNCFWSEGLLKVGSYGDTAVTGHSVTWTPNLTPAYDLTDDHFIPSSDGEEPITVDIVDQSDAYNIVQVEYLDRSNQYNTAIATAQDLANITTFGRRKQDPTTLHAIADASVAQACAQLLLQRTLYVRRTFTFTVGWQFALLEPMVDLLTITRPSMGLNRQLVRIIQIDDDEDTCRTITAEEVNVGVAHAPLYGAQAATGTVTDWNVDPGGVEANLLPRSQDWGNAAWTAFSATAATNAAIGDPYGGATGQLITSTAAADAGVYQQYTAGALPGRNFTFSVWLRQGNYAGTVRIRLQSSNGLSLLDTDVNPPAGAWQRYTVTLAMGASADTVVNAVVYMPSCPASGKTVWGWGAQLSEGVSERVYAATTSAIAGPLLFNPPSVLASTPQVWAAVAGGPEWGGANVYTSLDGTQYGLVGQTTAGPARYGVTTASFASGTDPDTTHTLSVDLGASGGQLNAASAPTADNGGSLCLVDTELVCFSDAALTHPSRYDLTTSIRRGYLNSAIAAHAAGAPFVRLDEAIFDFPYFPASVGQIVYVKFQSFNRWGFAAQSLADCLVYPIVPVPVGATSPATAAWSAVGTTLSNAGQSIPAIVITGASDNPSATGIDFEYRVTGASVWASAGVGSGLTTRKEITSVQSGQTYDVSVLYLVNGIPSNREIVASAIVVGSVGTAAAPGAVLINDGVAGSGKTFTCPAGSYGHVDIILTGKGGAGNYGSSGKGDVTYYGGGGGGAAVKVTYAVTPGATVFTYTLPASVGSAATCTAASLSLTANSGADATSSASGAGGSASGGSSNYTGHTGGLIDGQDGGGAADASGTYVDQTSVGVGGIAPGGGGCGAGYDASTGLFTGALGAGASLQIIARA